MNGIVSFVMSMPQKQLLAAVVGILLAAWFGLSSFIVSPVQENVTKVSGELDGIETQIIAERRIAANLDKYKREVEAYKAVKELADRQLPQGREVPNLLTSVQALAKDLGLKVRRFAPEPDKIGESFAEIPIKLEMRGSYHQVLSFFDEISRLSRIISVSDVSFKDPRGYAEAGAVGLDVTCTLAAYRQLEPSEIKKKEPEDGKKKGKKAKASKVNKR